MSSQKATSRPSVRDDLRELVGYHSPQVEVEVRLNTNEAPAPPPIAFGRRVAEIAQSLEWNRYPDRRAEALRRGIAELYSLEASQVFCANGSNEVLQTILLTYAGPGRRTLTFEPTYALHSHLSRITGAELVTADRHSDFTLDAEYGAATIERVRPAVTFLCSPNNPTGLVEPVETIRAILSAVQSVGGLLIVDEAYGEFAPHSAVEMLDEELPLVVTKTFSKTWAMAAARLGYALAPSWMVDKLDLVVLPYHLDAFKQAAGVTALEFVDDMNARVDGIVQQRRRIADKLIDLGCEVWPSGANFVLMRPPQPGEAVWKALVERSILVRNTASWAHLEGCLRITVGTPEENTRFLDALAEILSSP